jgi:hypothetical protein
MDNEDWRHLNEYWRTMYGDVYPHEKESNRGGSLVEAIAESVSGVMEGGTEIQGATPELQEEQEEQEEKVRRAA